MNNFDKLKNLLEGSGFELIGSIPTLSEEFMCVRVSRKKILVTGAHIEGLWDDLYCLRVDFNLTEQYNHINTKGLDTFLSEKLQEYLNKDEQKQ